MPVLPLKSCLCHWNALDQGLSGCMQICVKTWQWHQTVWLNIGMLAQKQRGNRYLSLYCLSKMTVTLAPLACPLCLWKRACASEILLPKASLDVCKYVRLPRNGTTWLGNFIGILPHNTWKKKTKAFLLSESSWLVLSPHLHARTVFESVPVPLKSSYWKSVWTYASMYEYLAMTPNCFATSWDCC